MRHGQSRQNATSSSVLKIYNNKQTICVQREGSGESDCGLESYVLLGKIDIESPHVTEAHYRNVTTCIRNKSELHHSRRLAWNNYG